MKRGPGLEPAMALCALLAGCDAQATERYDGESLLTVRGRVELSLQREDEAQLKPALAFQTELDAKFRLIDVSTEGAFPAEFTMEVLEPPPDEAIATVDYLSEQPRFAVGYIAAVTPELPREFAYDMPWSMITQTVFDEDGMRWDCDHEHGFCFFDEELNGQGEVRVRRTTCPTIDTPRELCTQSYPFEPVDMYRHFAGLSENYVVVYLPEAAEPGKVLAYMLGAPDAGLAAGYHLIAIRRETAEEEAESELCREEAAALALERYNAEHATDFTVEQLYAPCSSSGPCPQIDYGSFDLLEELASIELDCSAGMVTEPVEHPASERITVRIGPELAL